MWSRLRPYFKGFPAPEKVAQLMVMYGLRVHEGSVYAAGIKISDTSLARAASVDRRVVTATVDTIRSEEHTSELQSRLHLVCRLLLEKKKNNKINENIVSKTTAS